MIKMHIEKNLCSVLFKSAEYKPPKSHSYISQSCDACIKHGILAMADMLIPILVHSTNWNKVVFFNSIYKRIQYNITAPSVWHDHQNVMWRIHELHFYASVNHAELIKGLPWWGCPTQIAPLCWVYALVYNFNVIELKLVSFELILIFLFVSPLAVFSITFS